MAASDVFLKWLSCQKGVGTSLTGRPPISGTTGGRDIDMVTCGGQKTVKHQLAGRNDQVQNKEKLLGRDSQHPVPPPPRWVNSDGLRINCRKHMKSWSCGDGRIDVYLSACIIGYGDFLPLNIQIWSEVYVTGNESNTFPNLKTDLIMTIYWKGKVVFDYKWLCNRRRYSKIQWLKDVC